MHNSCIRTAWRRVEFLLFALFRLFHFVFNLVQVDFGGWKQIYYIMLYYSVLQIPHKENLIYRQI